MNLYYRINKAQAGAMFRLGLVKRAISHVRILLTANILFFTEHTHIDKEDDYPIQQLTAVVCKRHRCGVQIILQIINSNKKKQDLSNRDRENR